MNHFFEAFFYQSLLRRWGIFLGKAKKGPKKRSLKRETLGCHFCKYSSMVECSLAKAEGESSSLFIC